MFEFLMLVGGLGLAATTLFLAVYFVNSYCEDSLFRKETLFFCTLWTVFFSICLAGLHIGRKPETGLQMARNVYYECIRVNSYKDEHTECIQRAEAFYKKLTKEGRSGLTFSKKEVTKVDG